MRTSLRKQNISWSLGVERNVLGKDGVGGRATHSDVTSTEPLESFVAKAWW